MTQTFEINASSVTSRTVLLPVREAAAATHVARALPSPRRGSQAYFWSLEWQQGERLAAYDFLIDDVYKPVDANDLIDWLHGDDDA